MAAQHKNMKRIFELEWMLHRIKGKSKKHQEMGSFELSD